MHALRTIVLTHLTAALTALAAPAVAEAQTCLGLAPFSPGPTRLGATAEIDTDTQAFGLGLTVGSAEAAFGGVSVSKISYDDIDGNTTGLGISFGWQIPIGHGGRVQMCPGFGGALGLGPENIGGSGADLSSRSTFFGLQFGASTGTNPRWRVVPTAGVALTTSTVELEGGLGRAEVSDSYGLITLGVGFVSNSQLSVLPAVHLPVGLDGAGPSFALIAAINF